MEARMTPLRVGFYDVENGPTSFREHAPLTLPIAIAWSLDGVEGYWHRNAGRPNLMVKDSISDLTDGLERFRTEFWDQIDVVCGHNIRQHDNPVLQGARLRCHLAPLKPKLARDTLRDLIVTKGIARSLEAFCLHFELSEGKKHLSETEWEYLWSMETKAKRATVLDRCRSDVRLTIRVAEKLAELGYIR
jgi:hypothetical protein